MCYSCNGWADPKLGGMSGQSSADAGIDGAAALTCHRTGRITQSSSGGVEMRPLELYGVVTAGSEHGCVKQFTAGTGETICSIYLAPTPSFIYLNRVSLNQ